MPSRLKVIDLSDADREERLEWGLAHVRGCRERLSADGRNDHAVRYAQRTHSQDNAMFAALFAQCKSLEGDLYRMAEEYSERLDRLERALALTTDLNEIAARRLDDLNVAKYLADDARIAAASGSTLHRAYAMIEQRSVRDGQRRAFSGIASTGEIDRVGDRIDPLGATWDKAGVPLLHAHDHQRPIGVAHLGPATKAGVEFTAEIASVAQPGPLKDRVDTAWGEVESGIVRAVSIGFIPDRDAMEFVQGGGVLFKRCTIIELSTVAIPANASARITHVEQQP